MMTSNLQVQNSFGMEVLVELGGDSSIVGRASNRGRPWNEIGIVMS
jgi:hypothetical protein